MTAILEVIQASEAAAKASSAAEQDIARVAEWQRREGISFARRESWGRKLARVLRIRRRTR